MDDDHNDDDHKDELPQVEKMTSDILNAVETLGDDEARFLVDAYYMMQKQRISASNRVRALAETEEPHAILEWLFGQSLVLENQVKRSLARYAERDPVGQWLLSVRGIGPVITAGLIAHIDIHQTPTAGHIWSFAGLVPEKKWETGKKRPWNASLKTLCWKIGESFVKVKGHEEAFYGALYDQRKAMEQEKNEAGEYADQAANVLKRHPGHKQKAIYATGKLSPGHIHARAKRWVVKLFLAHLHEVWFKIEFGKAPPNPYPIAILGHAHKIDPV